MKETKERIPAFGGSFRFNQILGKVDCEQIMKNLKKAVDLKK